ncbi:hypothetical protein EJ02DRAFT_426327 [Clathrospora elynae]|uniref:Uncharacterized protein n=1 Tax=Clathrospora elynae TaxID=706981 RepID=A0A6A5SGW0_9PLEO|nr:hypothetical protein EJ02DRAFT_426327 [Clathrospora elynae]
MDTVWESFCDSYNGMYNLMKTFDTWYLGLTDTNSHLADEWPFYIRSELDMVVKQTRADLKIGGEIQKAKLERTDKCQNLPASNVGAFTG